MKAFNEKVRGKAEFSAAGDQGLHGDVIVTCSAEPKGFSAMTKVEDDCLAYGEHTGHAHKIFGEPGSFEVRECPTTKTRHLKVVRDVCLKHQEHDGIIIPPGFYDIGIQQEYDPFEKMKRQVID